MMKQNEEIQAYMISTVRSDGRMRTAFDPVPDLPRIF